jgi:hypothetical protein
MADPGQANANDREQPRGKKGVNFQRKSIVNPVPAGRRRLSD